MTWDKLEVMFTALFDYIHIAYYMYEAACANECLCTYINS